MDVTTPGTFDFVITVEAVVDIGNELIMETLFTAPMTIHIRSNDTLSFQEGRQRTRPSH
jgi:hypothetical protein